MTNQMGTPSRYGLENHGIRNTTMEYWTLPTAPLIERIVSRREGILAHEGGVVVRTGQHTGRAPNDKFIVRDDLTTEDVWWGKVNQPITPEAFDRLYLRMTAYFQGRDVFVQDVLAANHPDHVMPIRVITESAWHNLFARNMFVRLPFDRLEQHVPEFTVIQAPRFQASPEEEGTNSEAFIILNFTKKVVLIGGTSYAGEIKKSIFSVLNYLLPKRGVFPMHCSANVGGGDRVALFFGLSGTGKTTLSSDASRMLIGDDEHGWGNDGVFNFEGGCYAKAIRLNPDLEPLIYQATRHFGSVLENVCIDPNTRRVDFDDDTYTENTRVSYPIGYLPNIVEEGRAGHPTDIFFLTADAFGVIPPIAKLTNDQALYYFLSGYTSKLAGTEKGLGQEPQTTFSACFGAPFLPLRPSVYAEMLEEKLKAHDATNVWLVNTGWTGGAFGVGKRISLPHTRSMIAAALDGQLAGRPFQADPVFGLAIPKSVSGVPDSVLNPRDTWGNPEDYDRVAAELVGRFTKNFEQYKPYVEERVFRAGPRE
ncbi:MAG: phosphoenolpyruvate carboxykinase (ATP) [Chloroflexi bacterium]|nr:phosphoenolpyruvate carboxykinase (ATP) [Chloroflexota bacterium]